MKNNNLEDDDIIASFYELQIQPAVDTEGFHIATMNDTLDLARLLPPLTELYPNIVMEGDLCIMFGQSGLGKTIFGVQVGKVIAEKGKRVLYLDYEMSDRQLAKRYLTPNFPITFFRGEPNSDNPIIDTLGSIEDAIVKNHAEVVFVDNITALGQCLDKGNEAGTLMASLKVLKKKYDLTMIILNHIPKRYAGRPLSLEAMQGSAKLSQLVDDAIGLGQSYKDTSLVYVKQCKWRNGEIELDAGHVAVYERKKDECGNLCFDFHGYDTERALLGADGFNEQEQLYQQVKELHAQGLKQSEIAVRCGISQGAVSKILKRHV